MFDELVLPISKDLKLTVACEGFDAWRGMWLSHVFRCPLASRLHQIDDDHEASDGEVALLGHSLLHSSFFQLVPKPDMYELFLIL